MTPGANPPSPIEIRRRLEQRALEVGFDALGIAHTQLPADEAHLQAWLQRGWHGEMHYMEAHGLKRSRPQLLHPGTVAVISARMSYKDPQARDAAEVLADPTLAYVSRYALGRDYHKMLRAALKQLADYLAEMVGPIGGRVFVDSAPVLEKALAREAGLGWIGKHTNLIVRDQGSWFFLGELFTNVALPVDQATTAHCGSCEACITACPTGAIVGPWQLDARRCLSYLTIELKGSIPEEFRAPMGNRIYGCDDCQLVCPWNRHARAASHPDFKTRHALDSSTLVELFAWSATDFEDRTRGSAIHRIGYERWLRNIAVALGNAPADASVQQALEARASDPSALVREHVGWALRQQQQRRSAITSNPVGGA